MSRFRRPSSLGLTLWLLLLPSLWEAGCSRPVEVNTVSSDQHPVPFHEGDGNSSGAAPAALIEKGPRPGPELPFREPQSLPAGTLLTVRLKTSVSADSPNSSATFEALVDEPVTIDGSILVPSGASVAGRVESARMQSAQTKSARVSQVKSHSYVRLTLNSIDLAGQDQPLKTSSLFARGSPSTRKGQAGLITLEPGRRLTFRLTEPAYFAAQPSSSQSASSSSSTSSSSGH